jgi:hypothetical protein
MVYVARYIAWNSSEKATKNKNKNTKTMVSACGLASNQSTFFFFTIYWN